MILYALIRFIFIGNSKKNLYSIGGSLVPRNGESYHKRKIPNVSTDNVIKRLSI
jgi:hypothetical protein